MGPVDANSQTGIKINQTVGRHRIPRRRPQDGLQRNGAAGTYQPCVSTQWKAMRLTVKKKGQFRPKLIFTKGMIGIIWNTVTKAVFDLIPLIVNQA